MARGQTRKSPPWPASTLWVGQSAHVLYRLVQHLPGDLFRSARGRWHSALHYEWHARRRGAIFLLLWAGLRRERLRLTCQELITLSLSGLLLVLGGAIQTGTETLISIL